MHQESTSAINASTRYCAVYGWPIRHSASPAMQNAGLASLGLDWRYLAFEVHPDLLGEALAGARAMKFIGLNLTVPHKLLAVNRVDLLDDSARLWGAVNTVRFEGRLPSGAWRPLGELDPSAALEIRSQGFNTDAEAITRSLEEDLGLRLEGLAAVVLGAGGAGRVAALKLAAEGASRLWLVNRTAEKAATVAREINHLYPSVKTQLGYPAEAVDLILNATSLGLKAADSLPLDEAVFPLPRARAVYDMIYRPAETPLLAKARQAGCQAANGLGMLLYQGARALEIWTGRPAPIDIMRKALKENVYGHV
jgi:shikimate dehydrogenase